MTIFGVVALGLVLAVLAVLLWPLLRANGGEQARGGNLVILQEQSRQLEAEAASGVLNAQQYEAARMELASRALLEQSGSDPAVRGRDSRSRPAASGPARRSAWLLAALLPLLAVGLYARLGAPEALAPGATLAAADDSEVSASEVQAMLATMTAHLESQPPGQGDPAGWEMLGRTLASLQRYEEADRAYARAITLAPRNAQLLADRADLLMLLQGRSKGLTAAEPASSDESQRLIAQALAIDPNNLKALALAGSAAFEAKDFRAAQKYWSQARQLAPAGSAFAQGLDESLVAVNNSLGQAAQMPLVQLAPSAQQAQQVQPVQQGATSLVQTAAAGKGSVSGKVRLAPALQARLGPTDTLYIFARVAASPDGAAPRMPVAILRLQAKDLPLDFKLDDSLAMSPDFKLSGQKAVLLQARVSRSGQAMPQSGDLIGQTGPVQVDAAGVALVIDAVQP